MDTTRDAGLDGVTPFRFACHRCGNCCSGASGYVWLAGGEVERLAAAMGLSEAAFTRRFVRNVVDPRTGAQRQALTETEPEGGRCALLAGKNTCLAYAARPSHCRAFPYWESVLTDRDAFESARATCPGIAVVVDPLTRERAFRALAELHERLGPIVERAKCCLSEDDRDPTHEQSYATALEVDYALAAQELESRTPAPDTCRFQGRRPVACRQLADGEEALRSVRAIERATNYPAAYAPLEELLRTREVTP